MDSTLGKVLGAILVLLALAGVAAMGVTGLSRDKIGAGVADVATLAAHVRASYVNNPAGYASLTNVVAITAGDAPAAMV